MKNDSKLMDMLTGYTAAHRNPINVAVHMVGIPTIMLGVFIPLSWGAVEIDNVRITLADMALLGFFFFYMSLDRIFAVTFLVFGYLISILAAKIGLLPIAQSGTIAAVAFASGWIAQFIGHTIEKSMPVVLTHPVQAHLAAPFFTVVELFKYAGLRDKMFNDIQQRVTEMESGKVAQ
jgi:uncharacterized membrane protein YGL010W